MTRRAIMFSRLPELVLTGKRVLSRKRKKRLNIDNQIMRELILPERSILDFFCTRVLRAERKHKQEHKT